MHYKFVRVVGIQPIIKNFDLTQYRFYAILSGKTLIFHDLNLSKSIFWDNTHPNLTLQVCHILIENKRVVTR